MLKLLAAAVGRGFGEGLVIGVVRAVFRPEKTLANTRKRSPGKRNHARAKVKIRP